jgi:SAM-dependent methyltransferase
MARGAGPDRTISGREFPAELSVERFDPEGHSGTLVAGEHRLRYLWAARMVEGKSVLDAGCGTGYGSRILAGGEATRVVGVDIAPVAVTESAGSGIEFVAGDVRDLPFELGDFDVIVCFEVIEHIDERERAMAEFKRVLGPAGLLLLSSPNRAAYPSGNPHHVFEYLPEELRAEVRSHFANVAAFRQDAWLASSICAGGGVDAGECRDLEVVFPSDREPGSEPFSIVAASDGQLPSITDTCALGDPFEVRWWHDQQSEARHEVEALRAELERARLEARDAARTLTELETKRAFELEAVREAQTELANMTEAHAEAQAVIQEVQHTRAWRLATAYWRLRDAVLLRRGSSGTPPEPSGD